MNKYRHGDIGLYQTDTAEGELIKHNGSFVLAEGETTGHKHVISVPRLEDMTVHRCKDGGIVLTLKAEGTVTHEEHKTLKIAPGIYKINREKEFNYFENSTQRVQD